MGWRRHWRGLLHYFKVRRWYRASENPSDLLDAFFLRHARETAGAREGSEGRGRAPGPQPGSEGDASERGGPQPVPGRLLTIFFRRRKKG